MIKQPRLPGIDATFENSDVFGRRKYSDGLFRLLHSLDDSLVVAIDGPWGSGKSHFLRLFANEANRMGFPVLLLNAFQNDYHADPFLVISAAVKACLDDYEVNEEQKNEYVRRALRVASGFGLGLASVALRAATTGIVDLERTGAVVDAAVNAAANQLERRMEGFIKEYKERQADLAALRHTLSEIPRRVAESRNNDTCRPLLVIIDELDRCRPTFAIELLERIKHFFDAPGVHFILGCNLTALAASVRKVYGFDVDGIAYLRRFVDVSVTLDPTLDQEVDRAQLMEFIRREWDRQNIPASSEQTKQSILEVLAHLARAKELSLRDLQRVMGYVAIALQFERADQQLLVPVFAILALWRFHEPELFKKAQRCEITYDDVVEYIDVPDSGEDYSPVVWIHRVFRGILDPADRSDRENVRSITQHFLKPIHVLRYYASVFDKINRTE